MFSQEIKNRYFLSAEERLALITIVVAVSHIPFTTESLCQLMDISKNTLVTDIAALKKKLTEVGLFLHSSNKTGYEISGDETTLRFYVIECLRVFETSILNIIFCLFTRNYIRREGFLNHIRLYIVKL